MKKFRKLLAGLTVLVMLLTACASALAAFGCGCLPGIHQISFYARKGGRLLYTLETGIDGKLTEELRPTYRDGYVFMGWYTHPYQGRKIGNNTVFWKDTNVWAHWGRIEGREEQQPQPGVYTVTFEEDNSSRTLPSSLQSEEDGRLAELPEPSVEKRKGLKFLGWRNRKTKEKITPDTVFTSDASLQAVWGSDSRANLIYMSDNCLLWNKAYPVGTRVAALAGAPEEKAAMKRAFLGWFTEEEGGERVTSLLLTEDTVLYARWSEPGWTVTFTDSFAMAEDGTLLSGNQMMTKADGTLAEIPEGVARNSRFLGWYTDRKLTTPLTADTVFKKDARVWAKTEKQTGVRVTLNASLNGSYRSRVTPESILTKEDGTVGQLPQAVWNYSGLESRPFLGWFTADGTEVTAETVFTGDTEIYARWKEGYRITFASLGEPAYKAAYTDENGKLASLPEARRRVKGNTPLGWYTADGEKVTPDTVLTADTELVPKWGVTVTFFTERTGSWGTGRIGDLEADENGRLPYLPAVSHERGYPFAGWVDENGAPVTAETVFTADTKVYGTWDKDGNQITFQSGNGGLPDAKLIRTKSDGTVDALPGAHHKYGLPFGGWSKTEDGSSPVTADTVFSDPLTKLYAVWIPAYKVGFRANGGKVLGSKAVMTDGEGRVAEYPGAEHPLKLAFDGWYLGNRKDSPKAGPETVFTRDTWVSARWSVPEVPAGGFPVTLADRENTTEIYTSETGKLKNLPVPTRSDAVFYGWYTGPAATGQKIHNGTQIGGEMTFHAAWLIPLTEEEDR